MADFTEKAIIASFMELIDRMPYSKITVKAIAENCGVNRNTFYYHFKDIPDVLEHILQAEEEMAFENIESLRHKEDSNYDNWVEAFINAAKISVEYKKGIYHIYNSVNREIFEKYLNRISARIMKAVILELSREREIQEGDLELLISFYKSALTGQVMEWLDGGMKYDAEEKIRRMGRLMEGSIQSALERAEAMA